MGRSPKEILFCALAHSLAVACALDERAVDAPSSSVETEVESPLTTASGRGEGDAGAEPRQASPPLASGGGPGSNAATPSPMDATLTISFGGDGAGEVTLSAPGMPAQTCPEACQIRVPAGTSVTVAAVARPPYAAFSGWSTAACGNQPTCSLSLEGVVNLRADFQLQYNVAFTSSTNYDISELPRPGAAANAECARLAAAAGVHGTRWVAWLAAEGPTTAESDDITPAGTLQNAGGWLRTDGKPIARSRAALFAGEMLHPIDRTERGDVTDAVSAWSGVTVAGTLNRIMGAAENCNDWTPANDPAITVLSAETGSVGSLRAIRTTKSCQSGSGPIQCFGDDLAPDVPVVPATGRIAFTTSGLFTPGGGIAAADALCQSEACVAGLSTSCLAEPGTRTFRSYLHSSQQPAWERFELDGPGWVRVDGIPWLTPASLLSLNAIGRTTGTDVTAAGAFIPGAQGGTWLGNSDGGESCTDWTLTEGQAQHYYAGDVFSGFPLTGRYPRTIDCTQVARLLCLEL